MTGSEAFVLGSHRAATLLIPFFICTQVRFLTMLLVLYQIMSFIASRCAYFAGLLQSPWLAVIASAAKQSPSNLGIASAQKARLAMTNRGAYSLVKRLCKSPTYLRMLALRSSLKRSSSEARRVSSSRLPKYSISFFQASPAGSQVAVRVSVSPHASSGPGQINQLFPRTLLGSKLDLAGYPAG
jgi:hypothetical protein